MDKTTLKRLMSHNKEERLAVLRDKMSAARKVSDELNKKNVLSEILV